MNSSAKFMRKRVELLRIGTCLQPLIWDLIPIIKNMSGSEKSLLGNERLVKRERPSRGVLLQLDGVQVRQLLTAMFRVRRGMRRIQQRELRL